MKTTKLLTMAFAALVVCSCQTPMNINYFQDLQDGQSEAIQTVHEITVQPEDQLSIVVNSKDPLLADLFNLPIVTHRVGYSQQSSLNTSQAVSAYTVDHQGQIDFPVLGKVTVAGKNREQIAALIKSELIKRNLVNDPVVTVEFGNLYVSVLGEVARPGRFPITAARLPGLLPAAERRHLRGAQRHPRPPVHRQRQQRAQHLVLDLPGLPRHLRRRPHREIALI